MEVAKSHFMLLAILRVVLTPFGLVSVSLLPSFAMISEVFSV